MKKTTAFFSAFCIASYAVLHGSAVHADGTRIGKVYKPYVQLLERELEYRMLYEQDSDPQRDGRWQHRLGLGRSLSDRLFGELYVIANDNPGASLEVIAYEAELLWQLTEQGEFNNDWGVLLELEREKSANSWESSATLIGLQEWPKWVATGNLSVIYEWGSGLDNELETAFSAQLRYRQQQSFEPAIELYFGQDILALGPVLTGQYRWGAGKKVLWELGAIFDLDSNTSDTTWKWNVEFEF